MFFIFRSNFLRQSDGRFQADVIVIPISSVLGLSVPCAELQHHWRYISVRNFNTKAFVNLKSREDLHSNE
ncbi:CLUMA_CG014807, isoform A [Clunio marinus]|uniref:CLUMA_CG014807, isoform A n=1 Tax=Clunio marinus TaxID=568069 RepID=A0A1J1IM59_9DIPT|nr:CLUMA_CG014807, isoform A [Clunio marinus]